MTSPLLEGNPSLFFRHSSADDATPQSWDRLFDSPARAAGLVAGAILMAAVGAIGTVVFMGPSRPATDATARVATTAPVPARTAPNATAGPTPRRAAPAAPANGEVKAEDVRPQEKAAILAFANAARQDPVRGPASDPQARIVSAFGSPKSQASADTGGKTGDAIAALQQQAANDVPVADTEDQVVALEARMERVSAYFVQPDGSAVVSAYASDQAGSASASAARREVATAVVKPAAQPAPAKATGLQDAVTTKWVNMHAGPDNDAQVVTVVPANASIKAPASCKFWCEVEFKGQHGYIYKDFVARPGDTGGG